MSNPRLTLWVGTAGGSLGVFTVTRRSAGEPLQLEETGTNELMKYHHCFKNVLKGRAGKKTQLL